jgi:hypothetical protein
MHRVLTLLLTSSSSTYLLWHSLNHIDKHGVFSTHAHPSPGEKITEGDEGASANVDGPAPDTQAESTPARPAETAV